MNWNLPISVKIDGKEYAIRNKCDYRVVLDCISALNDNDLTDRVKLQYGLFIFYEDLSECKNIDKAIEGMFDIISYGDKDEDEDENKPRLMDWEHDFPQLAPPISRVLGYDVRTPDKYCHFWTFLGAYMEIGECTFSTIVSIRSKKAKGKKLDKWEMDYIRDHKKMVELPQKLTAEEEEFLNSDW